MPVWSHSHFLQSIGWATINSLWQMGLLWCLFTAFDYFYKPSAEKKYKVAALLLSTGFAWFIITAVLFYLSTALQLSIFEINIQPSNSLLQACLTAASFTYLGLLIFPVGHLFKNWQFVQRIKARGLSKASVEHRLYIQKMAAQLGLKRKVKLLLSTFVSSPLTIGFLKPIILLPIASINHLAPHQVEAILLHELAHIRRYDYLLNFLLAVIHTLLYFNPFVKLFMKTVDAEREASCDELVLQFGYDKIGYASALLHLEKTSTSPALLTLGAAGTKNLLNRIEKIVGMEKKKVFGRLQLVPILAALVCMLLLNSILFIKDTNPGMNNLYAYEPGITPLPINYFESKKVAASTNEKNKTEVEASSVAKNNAPAEADATIELSPSADETTEANSRQLQQIFFDDVNGSLSKEQLDNISTTVATSKKVLSTIQWKNIENAMADVLSKQEKMRVKQEYLKEVNAINWKNIEQNLKANYSKLDWDQVRQETAKALSEVKLDSLESMAAEALQALERNHIEMETKSKTSFSPLPDASIAELNNTRLKLELRLDSLKRQHIKKIIRL